MEEGRREGAGIKEEGSDENESYMYMYVLYTCTIGNTCTCMQVHVWYKTISHYL